MLSIPADIFYEIGDYLGCASFSSLLCSCDHIHNLLTVGEYYKNKIKMSDNLENIITLGLNLEDINMLSALISDDRFEKTFIYSDILKVCINFGEFDLAKLFKLNLAPYCFYSIDERHLKNLNLEIVTVMKNSKNVTFEYIWSAVISLMRLKKIDVAKFLLMEGTLDPDISQVCFLCESVEAGYIELVEILLDKHQIDPASEDKPIVKAARFGRLKIFKLLLKHKTVNPSCRNNKCLKYAIKDKRSSEFFEFLFKHDRFRISETELKTLIYNVCSYGNLEAVKFLLNEERIVNMDYDYTSIIIETLIKRHLSITEYLLNKDFVLCMLDNQKLSKILESTCGYGSEKIDKIILKLIDKDSIPSRFVRYATQFQRYEILHIMGALDKIIIDGRTILYLSRTNQLEILKILLPCYIRQNGYSAELIADAIVYARFNDSHNMIRYLKDFLYF
jgi:hypothetical protein